MYDKKIYIFIIILIVIILGLGGFIALDKLVLNRKENSVITQIGEKEIDLNIFYQINNTLDKFDKAFNDNNSSFFGYPYSKEKIKASDFDQTAALYLAIYDDLEGTNIQEKISSGIVKSNFENIFGNNLEYNASNISAGERYAITYDKQTDNYIYNFPTIRTIYSPEFVEINLKTTLEEGKLIVYIKVFYVEFTSNPGGTDITKANLYTSNDKKKLVATINLKNGVLNKKEIIARYGSKFATYKYTFTEKAADEYSFYSIEKEK